MEAFGIFTVANFLNKEATCLVSISDSPYKRSEDLSPEERQTALDNMIILALESIIKDKSMTSKSCFYFYILQFG